MQMGTALMTGLALLVVGLAGCTGGESTDGFTISGSGTTYKFTAAGEADNYTWDLGDRLTIKYGKTVTHTYDFTNGKINVLLTEKTGAAKTETRKALTLGNGNNAQATFILEGSTNWTVTNETFRLSAAASSDPDGDPLRYSWSCVRTGDATKSKPHVHGFGTVPYATPPAGAVTARLATGPLPEPTRTYDGDLCEALGSGGRATLDATIEGRFTKTGVYDVYLLASDPVHASTSGKFHFVVTDPEARPEPTTVWTFNGTFQGGAGGNVQGGYDQATQNEGTELYDRVTHVFNLPLEGVRGSVSVEITDDPSTLGSLAWSLTTDGADVASGTENDIQELDTADLKGTQYQLRITLDQGVDVGYRATVSVDLDMDPFRYY